MECHIEDYFKEIAKKIRIIKHLDLVGMFYYAF